MTVSKLIFCFAAGVAVICHTMNTQAAIVFQDEFTDNDRTLDPSWYQTPGTSLSPLVQSGGVLSFTGLSGSNGYFSASWGGSTLSNVGDTLSLSVTAKYSDPGASIDGRAREFSFAVGYDGGTPPTGDNVGLATDDVGYSMAIGGSSSGSNGGQIREDGGGNRWLGSGNDITSVVQGEVLAAETFKTFTLTIERTTGGYDLGLTDGSTSISDVDLTPVTSTFNLVTFGFYNRNPGNSLDVDSITVDVTAVPEPSSLLLVISVAGTLLLCRMRTR